jgi:putative transposase
MPRANRVYLPHHVWHVTHRCHDRAHLLDNEAVRVNWRRWLREATIRYSLQVLDFIVTSNHVHLLVYDATTDGSMARALQLVQGRTAQDYNRQHGRRGAFWQDRHHAVVVDSERYLWACLVYIDLNMVRAGVVAHPREWSDSGYHDIQDPSSRPTLVNRDLLAELTGAASLAALRESHRQQVDDAVTRGESARDPRWTDAVAVGQSAFVENVRLRLGLSRRQRLRQGLDGMNVLAETRAGYDLIRDRERARLFK